MRLLSRAILSLCVAALAATGWAQVPGTRWTEAYGGVVFEDAPGLVVLPDGDFVVAGNTSSPGPSFGAPGNMTEEPPVAMDYGADVLVARFDPDGNLIWERRLGGVMVPVEGSFPPPSYDAATGIALDAAGDLVVVATSNSAPDPGNPAAKQAALIGDSDIWVIKLAPDGTTLWENSVGGVGYELSNGVAVLPNGNYVVTGTQQPDPQRDMDQSGTEDLYAAVLAPDGALLNESTYGGDRYDRTWSTLGLSDGSVIIGGASASGANPGMGKSLGTFGNSDIYLVHLDPQGDYLRDYQFGSRYTEQPTALAEDAAGNVFVAAESKFTGDNVSPEGDPPTRDLTVYGPLGPAAEPDVYYLAFTPGASATVRYEGVYGGATFDRARTALGLLNGCIVFGGDTRSTDRATADASSSNAGQSDAWLVQLDPTGAVVNDASRGGSANENLSALANAGDGALLIAGASGSGPFEWNEDGAFLASIPEANSVFLAQLACGIDVDLGPDRPVCGGEVFELANLLEPSPATGCREWTWTDDAGNVLATTPTLTYEATADATVTLTAVGPFGCERSDDVVFTVASGPEIAIDARTDPACNVDDGSIEVSAPGSERILLRRSVPTLTETAVGDAATFEGLPAGTYTVVASSASGSCSDSTVVTLVTEGLDPDFTFAAREPNLCLGEDVEFDTDFSGFASYRILAPDGSELCSDASGGCSTASWTPAASGGRLTFTLEGTTTAGCATTFTLDVAVAEQSEIELTQIQQPTCDQLGSIAGTFTGGPSVSLNSADERGGGRFSYADLTAGTYTLRVAAANPRCSAEEAVVLVRGAGLDIDSIPDLEACVGEALSVAAPDGVDDPDVDTWSWLDLDTGQSLCDCSDLSLSTANPSSRTLALRATTSDGCAYTDTFEVDVYATPTLATDPRPESCGGASDGVIAVESTDAAVLLVDGVEFPVDTALRGFGPGRYEVVATSPLPRCRASAEAVVGAGETFGVELGNDLEVIAGETVGIAATVSGIADYELSWTGIPDTACADCATQTFVALGDVELVASATSPAGCTFSDTVAVTARQDRRVFIPNAFSPNGDNQNDRFAPFLTPFVQRAGPLRIFDRWGNLVFVVDDPSADGDERQQGWDGMYRGREASVGVYTYTLPVTYVNGESRVFRGDVTLLR